MSLLIHGKRSQGGNDVIVKTLNIVWKWQPLFFAKYNLFQYDFISQIFKYAISCHPLLQLIVQKLISIQDTVCHMCPNPTSLLMRKKWTAILLAVLALQPCPSLVEALMRSGIWYMVQCVWCMVYGAYWFCCVLQLKGRCISSLAPS